MAFIKNIDPPTASDEALAAAYRDTGNQELLAMLYQRYMDLVYAVCLKYLKDPEESKDAVMNIFEELVDKLQKHQVSHFSGWLYSVARTHCLMKLRRASKMKTVSMDPALMQSAEDVHLNGAFEKEAALAELSACMEKLGPEQKLAVELFYLQKKCYKEISSVTGLDWDKVRSLIQNGRRNLKLCMERSKSSEPHE